jgi:hypothetical protein
MSKRQTGLFACKQIGEEAEILPPYPLPLITPPLSAKLFNCFTAFTLCS